MPRRFARLRPTLSSHLLAAFLLVAGCASSPGPAGPAGPPEGAGSAVAVAAVAPAPPTSAVQTPAEAPHAPSSAGPADCFAKPVTLGTSSKTAPKPLDPALPSKLDACDKETDIASCRYGVARAYYEANHFEEAGPIFREIALHGAVDTGIYASQLYLECLNVIATEAEPSRPVCYEEMARDIGPLQEHLCSKDTKDTKEPCSIMRKIDRDIGRLKAEKLVERAGQDPQGAPSIYRQGGDAYMALFNQYCAFRRPDTKHKPVAPAGWDGGGRCDEIAYNAIKAYTAAKEPALAQGARAALLDPDNQLNKSELAKKAATLDLR